MFGGGFGSNNQSSGFGGFGSGNTGNTSTGFGSSTNTGFGSPNTGGGGLFGNTSSGFGSGGGGFGSNTQQSSPFGAKPAFGSPASTGGGLFGGNTATSGASPGFGGFGSTNTASSSPFGATGNTGGGLFGGASKPAFGTGSTPSSGGLFGGGGATSSPFGASNTTTTPAFGAPASTALGGATPQCEGTGGTAFQAYTEKEGNTSVTNHFQSITFMQPYQKFSFEELRMADYTQGRRYGNGSGQAGAFGASTGFGGFGTSAGNTGGFGAGAGAGTGTGGGLFGGNTSSSSPFGGGAQTNTGGFGSTANTSGGLFGNKPAGTGGMFGSGNTGGSTGGGLFGAGNTGGGGGGSGFGSSTGTGFGSGNTGNTGGGMFGGNTNTSGNTGGTGFGFGGGSNTNTGGFGSGTTSGGFGSGTNTTGGGGGLFGGGNTNTSTGFGSNTQNATSSPFGGFGQNQQAQNQNQTGTGSSLFGGGGGGGGFGANANQQKPAGGLFGNTGTSSTPSGGLFGGNTNQQSSTGAAGGLFGNTANNQQSSGGLFGGANKPATGGTGTGLFGGSTNTTGTSGAGGLFGGGGAFGGNQNQQQNQGTGGLFGNTQPQQKPGGLFGGGAPSSTGTSGGLFSNLGGNTGNTQQSSGLFGNTGANAQPQQSSGTGLFGGGNTSLFGGSQQQQQQPQQQQAPSFSTSIVASNPYGNESLFQSLGSPGNQSIGPIATPLSSSQKLKKSAILPQYKINPNASSRLVTPQKRGYGFSYSTLGSPTSTPGSPSGLGGSVLGGSRSFGSALGRGLSKSMSASSLRHSFDSDDSVLAPGAFSANSGRYASNSSIKRLTIDRSIRTDLFGGSDGSALAPLNRGDSSKQSGILKKKVSFDTAAKPRGDNLFGLANGDSPGALVPAETDESSPTAEEQGYLRSSTRSNPDTVSPSSINGINGNLTNGVNGHPEMTQVRGNELAVVPEHEVSPSPTSPSSPKDVRDKAPGPYYMKPSMEQLRKMSREQLKSVENFEVGRENVGRVNFNAPVDLSSIDLEDIIGKMIVVNTRMVTVYPEGYSTPPMGKGLNVPSTITLENSWPRSKDKRYDTSGNAVSKHIRRLKTVPDTKFVSYDRENGIWAFGVEHFTTYGLDYDDDEGAGSEDITQSTLSGPPESPTAGRSAKSHATESIQESSMLDDYTSESSGPDDTFEFRKKKVLPGAFNGEASFEEEDEDMSDEDGSYGSQSFLDEGSVASQSESDVDELTEDDASAEEENTSVLVDGQEMAGSFPGLGLTTELTGHEVLKPKSILKTASQFGGNGMGIGTPGKARLLVEGDWADQLQRTISPKKQDRPALRASQAAFTRGDYDDQGPTPKASNHIEKRGFATSIDLMNSLFGQPPPRKDGVRGKVVRKGFEWPYPKKSKVADFDESVMDERDKAFYSSVKPKWGPGNTLVYALPGTTESTNLFDSEDSLVRKIGRPFVFEGKDVQLAKFTGAFELSMDTLKTQRDFTTVDVFDGIPFASLDARFNFSDFAKRVDAKDKQSTYEKLVWELAHVLFDDFEEDEELKMLPDDDAALQKRVRKDKLSEFWRTLVKASVEKQLYEASTAEEKAIAYLSGNDIENACAELIIGKDFRLATLIALINEDEQMRSDLKAQLDHWREKKIISEMTEPIRTLWELLAGNTGISEGLKNVAVEDRAKTFLISERFGMDWRQAFGLRLWYGVPDAAPLEDAVTAYHEDLERNIGEKKPLPWFAVDGVHMSWQDEMLDERQDILWGILKLYVDQRTTTDKQTVKIEDVILPHAFSSSPVDLRVSFQLYHALEARRVAVFESTPESSRANKADELAWNFAAQLESADKWTWAVFILLHMDDQDARVRSIQDLLARHAASIGDSDSSPEFKALVHDLRIPEAWIWEAKALYARSVEADHVAEVEYLLRAKNWEEAHKTICHTVAPQAIIEKNYDMLSRLLHGFGNDGDELVGNWALGGQVYFDFVRLMQAPAKTIIGGPGHRRPSSSTPVKQQYLPRGTDKNDIIARLVASLPAMANDAKNSFIESVAIQEMAGIVGDAAVAVKETVERAKILQLPLTEDAYLKHSTALSMDYYRTVIATAR